MTVLLQSAHALPNHELELALSNGERRIFDVTPYLDKGVFTAFRDPVYFSRVQATFCHVAGGAGFQSGHAIGTQPLALSVCRAGKRVIQ